MTRRCPSPTCRLPKPCAPAVGCVFAHALAAEAEPREARDAALGRAIGRMLPPEDDPE